MTAAWAAADQRVVGDRVVAETMAARDHAADEGRLGTGLLPDLAEGRDGVVASEDVEDLRGVARGRAVVEGQCDDLAAGASGGEHDGLRAWESGGGARDVGDRPDSRRRRRTREPDRRGHGPDQPDDGQHRGPPG